MVFCLYLMTDWKVKGKENVPPQEPLLIIANHMNFSDPPLIAVSIPREMVFMAKEQLFKSKIWSYFVRGFGVFPVRRGVVDRNALRKAREALADGWCLMMFPEGMRSRSGEMRQAFPGSVLIAAQNKVRILPVGITGTEKMGKWTWIFKRPHIIVNIGKPFFLVPNNGKVAKKELADLTDDLMCRIAEMLPAKYHGCYAAKVAKTVK